MRRTPLEPWIARRTRSDRANEEGLTRKALEKYQLRKLRETIELARTRSRFYRERFDKLGPEPIAGLEDLARLPFTTAEDLESNPLGFLCASQGEISRVVTLSSSGTSGGAKRVFFTREDLESTVDFFHHGMSGLVDPGDRVLILLPGERPDSVGQLLAAGLTRLVAKTIPHGLVADERHTLEVILGEGVNSLVGVPTQVRSLARYGDMTGINAALNFKSVLLTTDHVPDAVVRNLEHFWGCRVFNHYGMTEMGLGGGVECEALAGYHLREADLFFEIIDPVTGLPAAEGEDGEIVFTTLTRTGMPLIRYRTGDVSSFVPGHCPCGSVLRRMGRVRRRLKGGLRLEAGGILNLCELDEAIFTIPEVLDFTAVLIDQDGRECLQIWVRLGDWVEDTDVRRMIGTALERIPSIAAAQESGQLMVNTAVGSCSDSKARNGKRVLLDQRNGGTMD